MEKKDEQNIHQTNRKILRIYKLIFLTNLLINFDHGVFPACI